jgi:hypothetical protein
MGDNSTFRKVLEKFKSHYSQLDLEHMLDRKQGEAYFDIGVTYQPLDENEKLVGLWRLESLEESFGAGGYLQGNLHTINTLGKYGALQAEMGRARAEQTHICFRSSYLLTYEATRRKHNSRDLFKDKEVYLLEKKYLNQMNRIQDIFQKHAPKKSYGVRDEFRVGGATFDEISRSIESLVCSQLCCD